MMRASSNCILKVVKPVYSVAEAGNHWFVTYHNNYINTFSITELTYDPYLFSRCESFGMVDLQTDDTLMLTKNTLTAMEEEAMKTAKFITKERACLLLQTSIKFSSTWIQLTPNEDITLNLETWFGGISLIKDHEASTTSSRGVIYTNLSL